MRRLWPGRWLFCALLVWFHPWTGSAIDMYDPSGEDELQLERVSLSARLGLRTIPEGERVKVQVNGLLVGIHPNGGSFSTLLRGFSNPPFQVRLIDMTGRILFLDTFSSYFDLELSEARMIDSWLAARYSKDPARLEVLRGVLGIDSGLLGDLHQSLLIQINENPGLRSDQWRIPSGLEEKLARVRPMPAGVESPYPARVSYREHLAPILERSCRGCHGPKSGRGPKNGAPALGLFTEHDFLERVKLVQSRICFKKDMPPPGSESLLIERDRALFHDFAEGKR